MPTRRPAFANHLKTSRDLITSYEEVRAGFVALALERNRRATPYVEEARALKTAAETANGPGDLLKMKAIRAALVTAAGVSDKAANHLTDKDKTDAIKELIVNFLEPAGAKFVEELVFRFLLTRGDTLGGSMRNIGGALAQRRLTRAVIAALSIGGIAYSWLDTRTDKWIKASEDDSDIEMYLRAPHWKRSDGESRIIQYNLTVPIVGNNVDLCLLKGTTQDLKKAVSDPQAYVAFGELKGGIDPAGADEHWKTARSALNRIREAFDKLKLYPMTFFVGAAIEKRMAEEIWIDLKKGKLSNAANLTGSKQLSSLCNWLISL
ncbi:type II restriction endonuclease [bacterium]|nr:type II restriction endonuclease [bacterium]MBU1983015.1 type II restriction endonuclease [bacterium]